MPQLIRRVATIVLALASASAGAAANRMILPDDVVPQAYRIAITPHVAEVRFDGSVDIDIDVVRRTDRIVLDAADLAIARASLDAEPRAARVALDAARQRATFTFGHPVAPGRHTLHIAYSGKINDQAAGLFRLTHDTPQGPVTSLFTMFEDSDARRFVPSWDEPARRATFELTVTVPADQMAIGNMPVAATEALPGGLQRVRFATTPKMATYLLFFGLGDFERVHRDVAGVDVGVVVKRGDTAQAQYALDAAAKLLPYYDDWFGTPYPLPKLDMVAGAGGSVTFGAMENWGAIFYFERDLLLDPRLATEEDRHRVFEVVAHEVAHQWFGNLVTMSWWDDLWLNEGFASWMQVKATQRLNPQWQGWAREAGEKQRAMDIDALRGTHPVIMHIGDSSQVEGAFDTITYNKGEQVVRTLEAWQGEEAFRAGVRRYISRHAYGNTVTDDLWRALDDGAARPVREIARGLTLQPGVPMITELSARCADGASVVTLSQGQFRIDGPVVARWQVPVKVAVVGGGETVAVVAGAAPQVVKVPGCGPVLVNAGQDSYARVRYTEEGLAALGQVFDKLSADDQLGVLADAQALALTGRLTMGAYLQLLPRALGPRNVVVMQSVVDQLDGLDELQDGLPGQPAFRVFARGLLRRIFDHPANGQAQPADERALDRDAMKLAGRFGDAEVLAQSQALFEKWRADPDALDGDMRDAALGLVAERADAATWELLHQRARAARSELEKADLYDLLGTARDPALAQRALALAISGEPPVTVAGGMLRSIGRAHPAATLDFVAGHWGQVEPLFGEGAGATIAARFFDTGADAAMLPRLQAFVAAHVPAATRARIDKNIALIRHRATIRAQRLPEADRWIAGQAGAAM